MEKDVLVSPQHGIFRTMCEVEDTLDPEVKIFRFKAWPSGFQSGMRDGVPDFPLRFISVYSSWVPDVSVGEREGRYRVTAKLETPDGYVGVFEGTTKPKPEKPATPDNGPDAERALKIEDAIMTALESESRMTLRTLKRKVHADRLPMFDECLKRLADEGELTIETERGLGSQMRTWVVLAPSTASELQHCHQQKWCRPSTCCVSD